MDLRIQRTRKCIVDAFMEIRKKKELEKITVKEIADLALINKATFYNHFDSVYDLSEQVEDEAVEKIVRQIPGNDWCTGEGTRKMALLMNESKDVLGILFADSRKGALLLKLDKKIKETIYGYRSDYKNDIEKNVVLTTMICGCFYAAEKNIEGNFEKTIDTIVKINDCLIKEFNM